MTNRTFRASRRSKTKPPTRPCGCRPRGSGLLVLMVLMLVYHVAQGPETAAAEGDVAAEGAEAEGGEGAEGEAEAAPEGAAEAPAGEAAPAEDDHAGHGH
jgi:hypothetical protein